jgi:hypothetical protein
MSSSATPRQISDQTWEAIRAEFTLPALEQVRRRLSELVEDPEPVMQQLVRVFIGEDTFCPGFQFLAGGRLHATVTDLFQRAMELKIPHNYFTLWMVTPSRELGGSRPVDLLRNNHAPLLHTLDAFGARLARVP